MESPASTHKITFGTPSDFGMTAGTVYAVCLRCAVLVDPHDTAREVHRTWHLVLDSILATFGVEP